MTDQRWPAALAIMAGVMGAGLALAAARNDDATLIKMEKDSWVAWQKHDTAFYQRFLSDDHVEVGFGGPDNKTNVVKQVGAGCTVKSFETKDYTVTHFSADTVLLTYWASQDTVCHAKVPSPVWVSSLYVKRKGKWLNAVYQQSVIPK